MLIIDDDTSIHRDYHKSLLQTAPGMSELERLEAAMFGDDDDSDHSDSAEPPPSAEPAFALTHAYQGQEAVELVKRELGAGRRYAVAFVDVRMPPGWNGIETTRQLWHLDPDINVVICSAHFDLEWRPQVEKLGRDNVRLLRKPFEPDELRQLAAELGRAWHDQH
ncbi:MAG: hypothetical protein Tsb0020_31800 [Haliangiales bacterium]